MERLVSRIAYKPNWRLSAHLGNQPTPAIIIEAMASVQDSSGSGVRIEIGKSMTLPPQVLCQFSDLDILRYLFMVIMEMERHEAEEWFKMDGVRLYDPHLGPPPPKHPRA